MDFDTIEEAHRYFTNYAYKSGFAPIISHHARTQSRKRSNEVVRITYACNKHGKHYTKNEGNTQEKELAEKTMTNVLIKTDCKCVMVISERGGVWRVTRVNLEHNHRLGRVQCPIH